MSPRPVRSSIISLIVCIVGPKLTRCPNSRSTLNAIKAGAITTPKSFARRRIARRCTLPPVPAVSVYARPPADMYNTDDDLMQYYERAAGPASEDDGNKSGNQFLEARHQQIQARLMGSSRHRAQHRGTSFGVDSCDDGRELTKLSTQLILILRITGNSVRRPLGLLEWSSDRLHAFPGFPSTQKVADINARAAVQREEKRQYQESEAMSVSHLSPTSLYRTHAIRHAGRTVSIAIANHERRRLFPIPRISQSLVLSSLRSSFVHPSAPCNMFSFTLTHCARELARDVNNGSMSGRKQHPPFLLLPLAPSANMSATRHQISNGEHPDLVGLLHGGSGSKGASTKPIALVSSPSSLSPAPLTPSPADPARSPSTQGSELPPPARSAAARRTRTA